MTQRFCKPVTVEILKGLNETVMLAEVVLIDVFAVEMLLASRNTARVGRFFGVFLTLLSLSCLLPLVWIFKGPSKISSFT